MPTEKKTKAPKEKKPFNFQKFWCIWNLAEAVLLLLAGVLSIVFFNYCYFRTIAMMNLSAAAILLYEAVRQRG